MSPNFSIILPVLLGLASLASAHTWIESMNVISPNGTFTGAAGYARGNVLRTTPGFSDTLMVNLIPPNGGTINVITPQMSMCMSTQQNQVQTAGSPRLQAAPGSAIALRYQENGHVTLPDNQPGKPTNRGTVYVYGTTQPSPSDSLLAIHRVWNAAGTGGDGRGVLLSTQNFDDGQCYQINSGSISVQRQAQFPHTADALMGANLWCQHDIALPENAPTGTPYTLYWVWDWPTLPGTAGFPDGKQEIYTTCMDVDIVGSTGTSAVTNADSFDVGQSLNSAAISSEIAQITNPAAVTGQTIAFGDTTGGAAASTTAANNPSVPSSSAFQDPGTVTSGFTVPPTPTTPGFVPAASSTSGVGAPATTQPAAQSTSFGGNGFHSHSFGGFGGSNPTSTVPDSAPATTAAPFVQGEVTVTEMDSVTQTVFQTVFNTTFNKRYSTSTSLTDFAEVTPFTFYPTAGNATESLSSTGSLMVLPVTFLTSTRTTTAPLSPSSGTRTNANVTTTVQTQVAVVPSPTATTADSSAASNPKCTAGSRAKTMRLRGRNPLFILPNDDC